jgi:hypothetical protein
MHFSEMVHPGKLYRFIFDKTMTIQSIIAELSEVQAVEITACSNANGTSYESRSLEF